MYPMIPTLTEKINQFIANQKMSTSQWLQENIAKHDTEAMREGMRYYENENDILTKVFQSPTKDEKSCSRIPHGYHKLLVDQKVSYLVGKPIVFSADDENLLEHINERMGEKWDDIANELVKGASNKGVEWLHPFIDEDGSFDYIIVPGEQGIPIFKDERRREIDRFIRYYPFLLDGEEAIRAEVWDEETVTYYMLIDGKYVLDPTEEINPQSHFYWGTDKTSRGYGWGKVPFIWFRNNEQETSDLKYYKQLIDAFDGRVSDNQSNFEEIQELIYVLKGYQGESLASFMESLKRYKAIKVDEDGEVDTKQAQIPMDSINSHLDRLRESIFTFGQGVDPSVDNFGNNSSGIALKFLYSLLDLKASQTERKFRKSIQVFMWFLCEYLSVSGQGEYDYKSVGYTFKYNMMVNDKENAEIAKNSYGIISRKTVLENHPWVDDAEEEAKRIEEERAERGLYDQIDEAQEADDDE